MYMRNSYNKLLRETHVGNLDAVKKFHEIHPEIHWTDIRYEQTGDTILHTASRLGYTEIIRYLLTNYEPNGVNCINKDNKTALHEAAQFAQHQTVKLLLEMGANVNALKKADWTPLMLSCTKIDGANTYKTVEILLQNGGLVNYQNKDGWSALHLIAREGDLNVFKLLLRNGLNVHKTTKNGRNALHVAALHENWDLVSELLDKIDVNSTDSCGNAALHEAILGGHSMISDLLLKNGAKIEARNKSNLTVLHLAAGVGDVSTIAYIINDLKFDVNTSNSCGFMPLHCAARGKKLAAYEFLTQAGADRMAKDNFGRIPAYYLNL